jgi:hypothetical protein
MNRPHAVKVLSEMRERRRRDMAVAKEKMPEFYRATNVMYRNSIAALSTAINALTAKQTTRRTP